MRATQKGREMDTSTTNSERKQNCVSCGNLVERVAQALERYAETVVAGRPPTYDWNAMARVAIAAMREPTEAMVRATDWPNTDRDSTVSDVWSVMISAALADPEGK